MRKFIWTDPAVDDLQAIYDYIGKATFPKSYLKAKESIGCEGL